MRLKLEELLFTKEEIPIISSGLFTIPVHPRLLGDDIKIDDQIANRVFPEAAREWYNDLKVYCERLEDGKMKEWIERDFLCEEPSIIENEHGYQVVDPIGWIAHVDTLENGLASCLSIGRTYGGSLILERNYPTLICRAFGINFSPKKFLEFRAEETDLDRNGSSGVRAYVYDHHNVDYHHWALFLRNWAILYMNEVFRQHFHELVK